MSHASDTEVAELIAKKVGHKGPAGPMLRLLQDLGLDGDDAEEFFDELTARYGTGFRPLHAVWSRHFRPEPTLLDLVPRKRPELEPITVAQVQNAVQAGAWPSGNG